MSKTVENHINLLKITNQYRIFIDTCFWMYPPSKDFLTKVLPEALFVRKATTKIPYRVIEEVRRKGKDPDRETRKRARFAASMINLYIRAGLAHIMGDKDDPDVNDKTVLSVFQKYSDRYLFCLFTRDRNLAHDVYQLRNQKAVDNKELLVFGIDENGSPYQWQFDEGTEREPVIFQYKNKPASRRENPFDKTLLMTTPLTINDRLTVRAGNTVRTLLHGELTIGEVLGKGKDGTVYQVKKGLVCKVFHKHKLSVNMYRKVMEMLLIPLEAQGVMWPIDLIFSEDRHFLGFVMKEAEGEPLQDVLFNKAILTGKFPEWNRQHLVDLTLSYLRAVSEVHEKGIIMGNVDLKHILVKNEKNISLINTDGYQINNYRIDRSLLNFTPPEVITQQEVGLRTREQDYYSIAVVLFSILFPGRMPYTFQGTNIEGEHVLAKRFEFPFHPSYIPNYEKSIWTLLWASLPFQIQQLFHETFILDRRIPVVVWENAIRIYRNSLKQKELSASLTITSIDDLKIKNVFAKCPSCKWYLKIPEREYKRIKNVDSNPLCERCHTLYTRKQSSHVPESIPKVTDHYITEKTTFLEAISYYRSEMGSD